VSVEMSMADIAARQRHLMLLQKIRANQPLTAAEIKELKRYEMSKKKTQTAEPAAKKGRKKGPAAGKANKAKRFLTQLASLAAAAVTQDEAENALCMKPGELAALLAKDPAAAAAWKNARIQTLVEVKTKLVEAAKDGKPMAARHIERMLLSELKQGAVDWQKLSTNHLADAFGVSRQTIHAWNAKHACPRNADGTYDLRQVLGWFERFAVDKAMPEGQKPDNLNQLQAVKTERLRLELAEKSGQLIDRRQATAGFVARIQTLVQTCSRKQMELAMQCAGQSPETIALILGKFFDQLRMEFGQIPAQLRLPAAAADKLTELMALLD
jgi:DNA-binding transcriptional regulator YiaG